MNVLRVLSLSLLVGLLSTFALADDYAKATTIGPVRLEMKKGEVLKFLGPPSTKSKMIEEGATGYFLRTWTYAQHNLELELAGDTKNSPGTVYRLRLKGDSKLEAFDGITVGSPKKQVEAKLKSLTNENVEYTVDENGVSLFFKKEWTVLFLDFKNGKVASIWLGPGPE